MTSGDDQIQYFIGIPEEHRVKAAELYDEAFGAKFSVAIADKETRIALIADGLLLNFGICAIRNQELMGVTGFHTFNGSLTSGMSYRSLLSTLGFFKGHWAVLIFSLYERTPQAHELVMDGIAVSSKSRGNGIGSALLKKMIQYAGEHQYTKIRLDVIDTNKQAKKLYERMGFSEVKTEHFEYLRWLLGFGASTTMEYHLNGRSL